MSKATYPLRLPPSMKAAATRLAKQNGVSLNEWIASAVEEKVAAITAAQASGVFAEWHSEADKRAYGRLAEPE